MGTKKLPRPSAANFFSRIAMLALGGLLLLSTCPAMAGENASAAAATAGEVAHKQKMRLLFPDSAGSAQTTPPLIPQLQVDSNPSGRIGSYQPNGPTNTANNAFFQNLGTNDRTCFTCHQPQDGWSVNAQHARDRFAANSDDPLFRLVDGAVCPSADVSTPDAKRAAYSLLLNKGLIRVGLPMQPTMEFEIHDVADPYDCTTSPTTGLTGPKSGILSVYRRPLPSANLGFLSMIMWDGREPDLFQQAVDATLGHAQGAVAPSTDQQQQIVAFEGCTTANNPEPCASVPAGAGVFTAQISDKIAGYLTSKSASGGPSILSSQLSDFFIGINDPLGFNPAGPAFNPVIFTAYEAWPKLKGYGAGVAARLAIARGEQVFNSAPITITGVGGLNDLPNMSTVQGFCGTCHDTPNTGNHSVAAPLNIGVSDAGPLSPPALDLSGLPVFTVWCTSGPQAGQMFQVTDLGRAMISGKCADIGKVKGPILRGLAARAPYFHNGSAASLQDLVEFYDQRFAIGLTAQEKADLVAFLNAL